MFRALRGAGQRREGDRKLLTFAAWLTGQLAQWHMITKDPYPKLAVLLGEGERRREQTPDEMVAAVRRIRNRLKGEENE